MADSITSVLTGGGSQDAAHRLHHLVRRLVRARHVQWFTSWMWQALLSILLLCAACTLGLRVGWLDMPTVKGVAGVAALLLVIWLVAVWRSRPRAMQVVLQADLAMSLRQKLSTAWEFEVTDRDAAVTASLARQAMRARLPMRPQRVFPVQFTTWARLAPAGAALLLLAAVVDLTPIEDTGNLVSEQGGRVDRAVLDEGARLLEFARNMEQRALTQNLSRTLPQATSMYRIGAAMRHGDFNRDDSLDALTKYDLTLAEETDAALRDAISVDISGAEAGQGPEMAALRSELRNLVNRDVLRRLSVGTLTRNDLRRLETNADALARAGTPSGALHEALERFEAGDVGPLRGMLDHLSRVERLLGDIGEIGRARVRIRRARRSLGDTTLAPSEIGLAGDASTDSEALGFGGQEDGPVSGEVEGPPGELDGVGEGGAGSPLPGREHDDRELKPQTISLRPDRNLEGVVMLGVTTRALPRVNEATGSQVTIERQFERQVEAVLAKEDYPLHRKELVRRYFLGLSQGKAVPQTAAAGRGTAARANDNKPGSEQ